MTVPVETTIPANDGRIQSAPDGVLRCPIHEHQLDEDMMLPQRAAAASHWRGQLIEAILMNAAVALAAAGIAASAKRAFSRHS